MKEVKKVVGNVFLTVGDKYISVQFTVILYTLPVFIIFCMYSKFSLKCFYNFGHVRVPVLSNIELTNHK